jgi:hypothetical protein
MNPDLMNQIATYGFITSAILLFIIGAAINIKRTLAKLANNPPSWYRFGAIIFLIFNIFFILFSILLSIYFLFVS